MMLASLVMPLRRTPALLRMMMGIVLSLHAVIVYAKAGSEPTSIVFYYGNQPNVGELSRFDLAVVEPDTGFVPSQAQAITSTQWFAYVSVGEISSSRDYYKDIPKPWFIGRNRVWHADVVDQTAAGWPAFFVEHAITPLWQKGYTGFFLDTLDSYLLVSPTELDKRESQAGLIAVIRAIRARYPTAALILNRGFELLPAVHEQVYAVAFESLFKGWSEAHHRYVDVSEDDRQWLMSQVKDVPEKYNLPLIAIDYCAPSHQRCSQETVKRIRALGMIPYVGDGRLQQVNYAALN